MTNLKVEEQFKKRGDYQSDIYEARVKIAITKWESGKFPTKDRPKRDTPKGKEL